MGTFDITPYLVNISHAILVIMYATFLKNSWADTTSYATTEEQDLTPPNARRVFRVLGTASILSSLVFLGWWAVNLHRQLNSGFDLSVASVIHATMELMSFAGLMMSGIALRHFLSSAALIYLDLIVILLSSTLFSLFNNHIEQCPIDLDFAVIGTAASIFLLIACLHFFTLTRTYFQNEKAHGGERFTKV